LETLQKLSDIFHETCSCSTNFQIEAPKPLKFLETRLHDDSRHAMILRLNRAFVEKAESEKPEKTQEKYLTPGRMLSSRQPLDQYQQVPLVTSLGFATIWGAPANLFSNSHQFSPLGNQSRPWTLVPAASTSKPLSSRSLKTPAAPRGASIETKKFHQTGAPEGTNDEPATSDSSELLSDSDSDSSPF
jgi:hypothetical protein